MDTVKLDDTVPLATRALYGLDVALTHVECRRWDQAADTLEAVRGMAPGWVQHQMLPGVTISRLAGVSVGRLRGLAHAAGVPLGVR
ncbi:hypothetical protein AB0890_21170 [Streptomyces sp. NPDC005406]|uniref:hypothetical protein n=1 Tax=Streptomyces sp. NPDC005406 TaxID=3155339 RepID=UPI0034529417